MTDSHSTTTDTPIDTEHSSDVALATLSSHPNDKTLNALGLMGTSLLACVRYHKTELPKRGLAALLSRLPKMSRKPVAMDLDLACLIYDHSHQLIDHVWYGKLRNSNESIRHAGDALTGARDFEESLINQEEIRIRPDELPDDISRLVFVLTSYHDQPIRLAQKGIATLMDNEGNIAHSFDTTTAERTTQAILLWQLDKNGTDFVLSCPLKSLPAQSIQDKSIEALDQNVRTLLDTSQRW